MWKLALLVSSILLGNSQAFPFLWPSSFRGSTSTTTTTTTHSHSGPPHPHAHSSLGTGSTPVIGHSQSSHLHVRPAITSSYLTNRPLPPLVGAHHHHQSHRPATTQVHGGSISGGLGGYGGSPVVGSTLGGYGGSPIGGPIVGGYGGGGPAPHRHHYHTHQQGLHHHHPHSTARMLHSHVHPATFRFAH